MHSHHDQFWVEWCKHRMHPSQFVFYCTFIAHLLLKASDLSCKKDTHEKESTKANIDFLPPMLSVCIGPTRSMCNSSKGWQVVEMHLIGLWGLLVCFPDLHPSHAPSCLPPNLGNPLMGALSLRRSRKFMWPKRLCHNSKTSLLALWQTLSSVASLAFAQ